jgi:hypothetical protein
MLLPASHHKSTIKKPSSAAMFSQKPLQKHHSTTPEKSKRKTNSRAQALPSLSDARMNLCKNPFS